MGPSYRTLTCVNGNVHFLLFPCPITDFIFAWSNTPLEENRDTNDSSAGGIVSTKTMYRGLKVELLTALKISHKLDRNETHEDDLLLYYLKRAQTFVR